MAAPESIYGSTEQLPLPLTGGPRATPAKRRNAAAAALISLAVVGTIAGALQYSPAAPVATPVPALAVAPAAAALAPPSTFVTKPQFTTVSSGDKHVGDHEGRSGLHQRLAYGFRVDEESPAFLSTTMALFALEESDVDIAEMNTADGHIGYSTSDDTRAEKLAGQAHLGGKIGPFSAAASMRASSGSEDDIKTARLDVVQGYRKVRLTSSALSLAPETKLTDDVVGFIHDTPLANVDRIAEELGIFFARAANMGGLVRKTFTMQVTEDDTKNSLMAEFGLRDDKPNPTKAPSAAETDAIANRDCADKQTARRRLGAELTDGGASLHGSSSTTHCGSDYSTTFHAEGGDTSMWLRGLAGDGTDDLNAMQTAWVASFTDDNLYPYVEPADLRPIWEVVAAVDPAKGDALQAVLMARWGDESGTFSPTKWFEARVGCTDSTATNYDDQAKFACEGCCTHPRPPPPYECRDDYCRDHGAWAPNNCVVDANHRERAHCAGGYVVKWIHHPNVWRNAYFTCCNR
jgi:hypothetical protein